MILGICGYGYTGSGAFVDLMQASQDVNYMDIGEFNLAYYPDGLEDLRFHLNEGHARYLSCDIALNRYMQRVDKFLKADNRFTDEQRREINKITKDFIDSITQVEWNGFWSFDFQEASSGLRKVLYRTLYKAYKLRKSNNEHHVFPERKMRLSIAPDLLDEKIRLYIMTVLEVLGYHKDQINVIDQVFPADNPEKYFRFYDSAYALIVDRDPRDVYILAKKNLGYRAKWIPTDNVQQFIDYFKIIRENEATSNAKRILRLNFEDLIYDYFTTIEKISLFTGVDFRDVHSDKFDPAVSINNTQLFIDAESGLKDDIRCIESNLSPYLYDFGRFEIKPNRLTRAF